MVVFSIIVILTIVCAGLVVVTQNEDKFVALFRKKKVKGTCTCSTKDSPCKCFGHNGCDCRNKDTGIKGEKVVCACCEKGVTNE